MTLNQPSPIGPRSGVARRHRRVTPGRRGYVLLETAVATGMLIVGLAVIGAQVQQSDQSVRKMQRRIRAILLAQQQLAELDLGLVQLDSVGDVQDGDFGPRYPDYGWLLTTDKTAIDGMFLLRLDILHHLRDGPYKEDDFDLEAAKTLYTAYAMRPAPRPINFAEDFGLNEEELSDLSQKIDTIGIPGIDIQQLDLASILRDGDFEEILQALPPLLNALNVDPSQLLGSIPPDLLAQLRNSGVLGEEGLSGLLGEQEPQQEQSPQQQGDRPQQGNRPPRQTP